MKKRDSIMITILLLTIGLMAGCFSDPNMPQVQITAPENNIVTISASLPVSINVAATSQVPGDGTYPLTSFAINLVKLDDRIEESNVEAYSDNNPSHVDGAYAWNEAVQINDYSDYKIVATVKNGYVDGTGAEGERSAAIKLRVEPPAQDFPGGDYELTITKVDQSPANCMLNQFLLNTALGLIGGSMVADIDVPSGQEIYNNNNSLSLLIDLPFPLPMVNTLLSLDTINNRIIIDGQGESSVDFTGMAPIDGFDCILLGTVDGEIDDLDPGDPDGTFTFDLISISAGAYPGAPSCSLSMPDDGDCTLIATVDADFISP